MDCGAVSRHRSESTVDQAMSCCLAAPNHYLNQCWLLNSEILWYSVDINCTPTAQVSILYYKFRNYTFKSPSHLIWVNELTVNWHYLGINGNVSTSCIKNICFIPSHVALTQAYSCISLLAHGQIYQHRPCMVCHCKTLHYIYVLHAWKFCVNWIFDISVTTHYIFLLTYVFI